MVVYHYQMHLSTNVFPKISPIITAPSCRWQTTIFFAFYFCFEWKAKVLITIPCWKWLSTRLKLKNPLKSSLLAFPYLCINYILKQCSTIFLAVTGFIEQMFHSKPCTCLIMLNQWANFTGSQRHHQSSAFVLLLIIITCLSVHALCREVSFGL